MPLNRLYYRITDGKDVWFFSGAQTQPTPERQLKAVQRTADRRGLKVIYTLATFEEYSAYRAQVQQVIRGDAPSALTDGTLTPTALPTSQDLPCATSSLK